MSENNFQSNPEENAAVPAEETTAEASPTEAAAESEMSPEVADKVGKLFEFNKGERGFVDGLLEKVKGKARILTLGAAGVLAAATGGCGNVHIEVNGQNMSPNEALTALGNGLHQASVEARQNQQVGTEDYYNYTSTAQGGLYAQTGSGGTGFNAWQTRQTSTYEQNSRSGGVFGNNGNNPGNQGPIGGGTHQLTGTHPLR